MVRPSRLASRAPQDEEGRYRRARGRGLEKQRLGVLTYGTPALASRLETPAMAGSRSPVHLPRAYPPSIAGVGLPHPRRIVTVRARPALASSADRPHPEVLAKRASK